MHISFYDLTHNFLLELLLCDECDDFLAMLKSGASFPVVTKCFSMAKQILRHDIRVASNISLCEKNAFSR